MTRSCLAGSLVVAVLASSVAGCGGAAATAKTAKTPEATASPSADKSAPPAVAAGDHALRRSAVRTVVKGGLGLFLQKVTLDDEPVMKQGHFRGFRIAGLRDPGFWTGVDLQPGDVVIRVNGMAIEHPEEALEVFHSLESASELRVAYERDGQMHELKYPIVDDEPQRHADASAPSP
jgi:type II secretory pathway component PulC